MPKIVDHEERRSRVAEAVCRLIARGGFEAVTLRAVAAEANSSLGAVQHYLKTRDDMLMAALQHISHSVTTRAENVNPEQDWRDAFRDLLAQFLPLDQTRRIEGQVWLAFTAQAVVNPRLGEALREANTTSHTNLTRLLARARDAGLIHPDLDPADTATDLLALVDGLTMQGLTDPDRFPPAHLIAVLERHIARLPAGSAPSER